LVNTRTIQHRRLRAGTARRSTHRRRRMRQELVELAGTAAATRLRSWKHARLYVGVAVGVALAVAYLFLAAQVTQTSYQLAQLQNQQAQLMAEQAQLQYGEADLRTPAQVDRAAQQAGLRQRTATGYVGGQVAAIDLGAPIGQQPADSQPLWEKAVAAVFGTVTGTKDVLASER
jgi:cell division protein FtsL